MSEGPSRACEEEEEEEGIWGPGRVGAGREDRKWEGKAGGVRGREGDMKGGGRWGGQEPHCVKMEETEGEEEEENGQKRERMEGKRQKRKVRRWENKE